MEKKTMLGIRVYNFAKEYNIKKSVVQDIINNYIEYCKIALLNKRRVDFLGLCTLVPEGELNSFNSTLAYDCKVLSSLIGVAPTTIYSIVKAYLDDIKADVLSGKVATIRGIVTIKPVLNEDGTYKIHSAISLSFKKYNLKVRVHTSKLLKYYIRQVV